MCDCAFHSSERAERERAWQERAERERAERERACGMPNCS